MPIANSELQTNLHNHKQDQTTNFREHVIVIYATLPCSQTQFVVVLKEEA